MNNKSIVCLLVIIILFQNVPTEGQILDPVKNVILTDAITQIPVNIGIRFLTPILLPIVLIVLIGLGPIGISVITALNFFAPKLVPFASILRRILQTIVQTVDPIVAQIVNLFNLPFEAVPKFLRMVPFILPLITLLPLLGSFGIVILWNVIVKNGILHHLLGNNLSLSTLVTSLIILLFFKRYLPNTLWFGIEFIRTVLGTYAMLPFWVPITPFTFILVVFSAFITTPIVLLGRQLLSPIHGLLFTPLPAFLLPILLPMIHKLMPTTPFSIPFILSVLGPSVLWIGPLLLPALLPFLPKLMLRFLAPLLPVIQPIAAPFLRLVAPFLKLVNPLLPVLAPIFLLGPLILPVFLLGSFGKKILPLLMFSLPLLGPLLPLLGPLFPVILPLLLLKPLISFLSPFLPMLLPILGPLSAPLLFAPILTMIAPIFSLVKIFAAPFLGILRPLLSLLGPLPLIFFLISVIIRFFPKSHTALGHLRGKLRRLLMPILPIIAKIFPLFEVFTGPVSGVFGALRPLIGRFLGPLSGMLEPILFKLPIQKILLLLGPLGKLVSGSLKRMLPLLDLISLVVGPLGDSLKGTLSR